MRCPTCGHSDDRVLESREQKDGTIRRRRECLACKFRFSTQETLLLSYPFVIKKDGRTEPFSKEKIFKGIQAACQKRPVSLQQMESLVEKVAAKVAAHVEKEVPSTEIGQFVMGELHKVDNVAYVRFASVYRNFKDVQEFVESLESKDGLN